MGDRPVAHHTAIHEHMLGAAHRTLIAKRRDETTHADAGGQFLDEDKVGPVAIDLIEALRDRAGRRRFEKQPVGAPERESPRPGSPGRVA
jgi:hypothetical protein